MKSRNYNIKQIAENQNVLQIYLYGEIEPSCLNICGDLVESKTSAEYIRKAIEKAETINGIELYINSIGGYVHEGVCQSLHTLTVWLVQSPLLSQWRLTRL